MDDQTKYLVSGSLAHQQLRSVVCDKTILKDMVHLTQFSHTGSIEVYHSLRTKYAPKRIHFRYEGM